VSEVAARFRFQSRTTLALEYRKASVYLPAALSGNGELAPIARGVTVSLRKTTAAAFVFAFL